MESRNYVHHYCQVEIVIPFSQDPQIENIGRI